MEIRARDLSVKMRIDLTTIRDKTRDKETENKRDGSKKENKEVEIVRKWAEKDIFELLINQTQL